MPQPVLHACRIDFRACEVVGRCVSEGMCRELLVLETGTNLGRQGKVLLHDCPDAEARKSAATLVDEKMVVRLGQWPATVVRLIGFKQMDR